jgi:hypothetical protein
MSSSPSRPTLDNIIIIFVSLRPPNSLATFTLFTQHADMFRTLQTIHRTTRSHDRPEDPPNIPHPPNSRYSGTGHPLPPFSEPAVQPVRMKTQYPRSVRVKPSLPKHPETRQSDSSSRCLRCCWEYSRTDERSSWWSWSSVELFEPDTRNAMQSYNQSFFKPSNDLEICKTHRRSRTPRIIPHLHPRKPSRQSRYTRT